MSMVWHVVVMCGDVANVSRDRKTVTFLDDYTQHVRLSRIALGISYFHFLFRLTNIGLFCRVKKALICRAIEMFLLVIY